MNNNKGSTEEGYARDHNVENSNFTISWQDQESKTSPQKYNKYNNCVLLCFKESILKNW